MTRRLAVVAAVLAVLLLAACRPLVGTVTLKAHEPAHTYYLDGYRTHTRQTSYTGTCMSTTTSGKQTRTTTRPCTKYRSVTYSTYDHWTEFQPECWRLVIEYERKPGDLRSTTRCVPARVWQAKQVGDHYDSDQDR